ncbi:MAG: hypothetical protein K2Z81_26615 [Cyanobacteria bacterium]|nr:hypothetical protein [Cyanobacteriota bacterium]
MAIPQRDMLVHQSLRPHAVQALDTHASPQVQVDTVIRDQGADTQASPQALVAPPHLVVDILDPRSPEAEVAGEARDQAKAGLLVAVILPPEFPDCLPVSERCANRVGITPPQGHDV